MTLCPKCSAKGMFYDRTFFFEANQCYACGYIQQPGAPYMQSPERQVTGKNERFGIGDAFAQFQEYDGNDVNTPMRQSMTTTTVSVSNMPKWNTRYNLNV